MCDIKALASKSVKKFRCFVKDHSGIDVGQKALRPWLDDCVDTVRPYLGHCYNLDQLKGVKDSCCFSTYLNTSVVLGQMPPDNKAQLDLSSNTLLDGGCVGFRSYEPIGEEAKTVFFCKNRYLQQLVIDFNVTSGMLPVTVNLFSVPAGSNPPLPTSPLVSVVVDSLPVVIDLAPPSGSGHHELHPGSDYYIEIENLQAADISLSNITSTVVCGPLKCCVSDKKCCVSLFDVEVVTTDLTIPFTGTIPMLTSQVPTDCVCLLDDSRSFQCCTGQTCKNNQLELVLLSLPVELPDPEVEGFVLIELLCKDVVVSSQEFNTKCMASGVITACLDPRQHYWASYGGPWSIRLTNKIPSGEVITVNGIGTLGVACATHVS